MLFALPVLLLVCLSSICGNDVTERHTELNNTHFVTNANRTHIPRNQPKITRDDQLLSLLAARRRLIIQNRFKNHIQHIVEISTGQNSSSIPKTSPITPKTINVHLNLSELLLHNSVGANSSDEQPLSSSSTESNVVIVSSARSATKPTRKNVDAPQIPENKNLSKPSNMPIIRNILYRRKMSFLNRKLPLDFDQIAFDTLGLSEINKTPEDLIFDNEDSLQVEESSHDKLIYYDVKNNASKKSGNNFEDASDEMKSITMNNKTLHNNIKNISTIKPQLNATKNNSDDILVKLNTTNNKTETKNTTRFMSPSLYNYFRPLEVPEEEIQPFLHFGDKLSTNKQNQSTPNPIIIEKKKLLTEDITSTIKNEEEINENMDVLAEKTTFENKITKVNLPNPKVSATRDYYKNRIQNKNLKNITDVTVAPKSIKIIHSSLRNNTRNRGFRNTTIFYQNKRNGLRQTINLKGNISLADLKPVTSTEIIATTTTISPDILITTSSTNDNKTNNKQIIKFSENITSTSQPPETIPTTTKTEIIPNTTLSSKLNTFSQDNQTETAFPSTTNTIPTTRILSTAVVTSVSIESSKSKLEMDQIKNQSFQTATDINDLDATVVAALSNFTLQAFQNKSSISNNSTRNPATIYPDINIEMSSVNHSNTPLFLNRTKFILRPNKKPLTTTQSTVLPTEINTSTDFIIHVPDVEISSFPETTTSPLPEVETTTELQESVGVKIQPRINYEKATTDATIVETSTMQINKSVSDSTTIITEKYEETTRLPIHRVFNSTDLSKPDPELPLATLFSVTEFKRPETVQNDTKPSKIPNTETVISRKSENDVSIDNVHAAYILAALGFIPMMVIVIYVIRSVMKKKHKIIEDFETELQHDSEKKSIIHTVARLPTLILDSSNRWEFPRTKLRLQTLLGQGNFGQVWKAEADDLKGHVGLTRLVAVKTIKDGAGTKERDDLLKELAIMQKMGSHPNVVTLLGCCTDKEPYLVIMEYVMYGKLLTFLRDHRTRRDYYNFSDDAATLTARDLTVFAYCVARGMEYLSSKGIIHRDLAARNILVDHNKLCKIADFGMSRDVGSSGEISEPRQPRNALPVRWMAVESLLYSVFTHKTDVWAYGVLLWEIVTLGSSPYANMSGREVMRLVCDGYRLERPSHCRPELYRVMASAWLADPMQRPSFAELRADIAGMLDSAPAEGSYVDLESFRADSTVYEIDNCTPRGNYFTVKSRFSEFECDI